MNETHNPHSHHRLWLGWYALWHEADASKPKPSYEDWLEARIEVLERAVHTADVVFSFVADDAKAYCPYQWAAWQEAFAALAGKE